MYRITGNRNRMYAFDIGDVEDLEDNEQEQDNIREFINSGEAVLLVYDLYDAATMLGIDEEDIHIVENDAD